MDFGLLGKKLSHSFSAEFFNGLFEAEEINAEYKNFEIEDMEEFPQIIRDFPTLRGLNVTIPYKEDVIPYLYSLSPEAKEIGAVNTILITHNNGKAHLRGYNTDAYGFAEGFRPLIVKASEGPALILGTGGAAKAVGYALRENFGRESKIVGRRKGECDFLWEEVTPEVIRTHPIIVNATPLGMYPDINSCPDIPYEALTLEHTCLDLVYNPRSTEFCRRAMRRGADVQSGLGMLHFQALRAWEIWSENSTTE